MDDDVKAAFERLLLNTATQDDRTLLSSAFARGALVTGPRAVAVGGNASDVIITTGDHNVVFSFKGINPEFLQTILNSIVQRHGDPSITDVNSPSSKNISERSVDELRNEYFTRLAQIVGKVYILGEPEPRDLQKVFVKIKISEEYERPSLNTTYLSLMDGEIRQRQSKTFIEPWVLEQEIDQGKQWVAPDELLYRYPHAIITGAPGSGKTTILKYLAFKALNRQTLFPVFFELKTITDDTLGQVRGGLAELLFSKGVAAKLHLSASESEKFKQVFFTDLAAGKVAIFLDGLDEVSGTSFFLRLCDSVNEFLRSDYHGNIVIISTRPYALHVQFEHLREMEIAPLNWRQISQFIQFYYGEDAETPSLLKKLHHRELFELARTPFFLGVILQLYRKSPDITRKRLELYRQIVWRLAGQTDREKGVQRFEISDPDGSLKLDLLRKLALERLLLDKVPKNEQEVTRFVFTSEVLLEKTKEFLSKTKRDEINPYVLVADVKATPLLREIGTDTYAFAHLTIQEYLAAIELLKRGDYLEIFCRACFDPTIVEMELLPMALGAASEADVLHNQLKNLPESLSFCNLRLRARSLAYLPYISHSVLEPLIDGLVKVLKKGNDDSAYVEDILHSFPTLDEGALDYAVPRVLSLIENVTGDLKRFYEWQIARALSWLGGEELLTNLVEILETCDDGIGTEQLTGIYLDSPLTLKARFGRELFGLRHYDLYANFDFDRIHRDRQASAPSPSVEVIIKSLTSKDVDQRALAYYELARSDEFDLVGSLGEILEDGPINMRWRALEALGYLATDPAIDKVIESLSSKHEDVRGIAASVLGKARIKRAESALITSLKDRDSNVRWRAAAALGQAGGEQSIDALIGALRDEDQYVRGSAASSLGYIGDARAIEPLAGLLQGNGTYVRGRVVVALGQLGGQRTYEVLAHLLRTDPDEYVRARSASVFATMKGTRALPLLAYALKNGSKKVRLSVLNGIRERKAKQLQMPVIETLNDADPDIRLSALESLLSFGEPQALSLVIKLVDDTDSTVRARAVKALGYIGDDTAVPALLSARSDEARDVSTNAAKALQQMDAPILIKGLLRASRSHVQFVRSKAVQVIGYYTNDTSILKELSKIAETDSDPAIRLLAMNAQHWFKHKLQMCHLS